MATLGEYLGAGASTTKLLLHLNGNSTDSSGNNNNGTDTNITYSQANGKFGMGAGFNSASNSKIVFGSVITPMGQKTISLWLKNNQDSWCFILRNCFNGNSSNGIGVDNSGSFEINRSSGTKVLSISPTTNVKDNVWHNVIFTWDGTTNANMVKLYVDGKLESQATANYTETLTPTYNLTLGQYNDSYDYTGALDEVIIENRAWSAEEVKKYYTNSRGFFATI
jgi:hypothetical protein